MLYVIAIQLTIWQFVAGLAALTQFQKAVAIDTNHWWQQPPCTDY